MKNRGFTLLELLIVLGLIVMLLGLGIPGIFRMSAWNQLKSATQNLQGILYRTRLDAMKSGKAIVFRYQYNSSIFEILPKEIFDQRKKNQEGLGAVAVGPELLMSAPSPEQTPEQKMLTGIYQKMLPPQIIFGSKLPEYSVESSIGITEATDFTGDFTGNFNELSSEPTNTVKFDDGWSPPILFFPNGRTSQAVLFLRTTDRYRFQQELTLRGLTGTAKIKEN